MGIFASSDKVRFKIVKEDACEALFSVEVPAAQVETETQNALVRFQSRAKFPGFRPGKAPLDFVRRQFGERQETLVIPCRRLFLPDERKDVRDSFDYEVANRRAFRKIGCWNFI